MERLITDADSGFTFDELRRMTREGEATRVRPGAYLIGSGTEDAPTTHRRMVQGTLPRVGPDSVVSHSSAAVLHGLPVWDRYLTQVHLTRARGYGGRKLRWTHLHVAPIDGFETANVDGIRCTGMARTVTDLARTLPTRQAVAAGDRALVLGLDQSSLTLALARAKGWPGIRRARRVIEFLDARSESPGESHSRVVLSEIGREPSHLQYEVRDPLGRVVARTDFCWDDQRTIGEFDGRIKYGKDLNPGQDIEEVLFEEKRREDAIRDLGWQVVRWTWRDLAAPGQLRNRIDRAFTRATRHADPLTQR